jgi:hypothetical protein
MCRRYGLIIGIVVLLAGCTGGPIQETTDPVQTSPAATDSPTVDKYLGCPFEPQNYTPKEVPDVPEEITGERVSEYAESHATAEHWNRAIANATDPVRPTTSGYTVRNLNETSDGYFVTVSGFGYKSCSLESDGNYSVSVSDSPIYTYLINETVVIRHGGPFNASRVREKGTVIARLNQSSN